MAIDAKRVQDAFLVAIEVADEAEQAAVLDRLCDGDRELRRRVEALLAAHDQPESLPHPPADALLEHFPATTDQAAMHRPGTVIAGRYKLLEQIGEGGMGAVWVAEQTEPVRRRVALKLIKPGMDTKQVLSRFAAERQALALMDHPNIAKVYDGGMTDEGRPFFVMEYVKGVPITDYCDQAKLSIDERLKLFLPICQAVQHAHQKGIIHRDLKPSNLLVCLYDGQAVPKVIDFGLAKAISQPLTEHTLYTAHGLMVGTPLYMSPEQAEFNNLDVDTRTDIYSLGVVLYELLTGTTPLEKQKFKDAAFQEILRLIKEEEPPRPSTKISGSATLPALAAQRGLEPAQLSRVVRGELDWIVMKALEKERSRRYETASSLTRDLEHYLHDEPVEACPPSLGYRFSKFTKRNMRALVTASLFSIVVLGAVISIAGSIGWVIRDGQTRQAVVEQKISLALDKAEAAYEQGNLADAQAAVHQAEGLLASSETRPEITRRFRQWMDDLAFVERLERVHLEKAAVVKDEHFDPASAAAHYSKAFQDHGFDLQQIGPLEAARLVQSAPIKKHLVAALDDWAFLASDAQRAKLLAIVREADSDVWRNRLRTALESDEAAELKELADDEATLSQPAVTIAALAHQLAIRRERPAAQALLRRAHGRYSDDFWINEHLGNLLLLEGKAEEAAIYLRIACTKFPGSPVARNSLAVALDFSNKSQEAMDEYRAIIRSKPDFAMPHHNLASALARRGKLLEAEALFREAARLRPDDGPTIATVALCLAAQNKNADAEKAYLEALNLAPNDWEINADYLLLLENSHRLPNEVRDLRSKLSANPNDPLLHRLLGDLLRQSNDPIGAEGAYRDAIRLDPQDFFAHTKLGGVLIEQDKPNDSLPVLHEAIHLAPDFPWAHWYLGAALSALEKWTEAEQSLRKAWELSPFNYLGYFMLMTSVRNQNKSTTDVPRPFLPATSAPFSYPGGAGPTASFKGQFELGAVMHTASPFQIADRVLARGRDAASRGRTDTRGTSLTRANQEATLRDAIAKYPKDWAVREKLGAHLLGQRNTKALYTAMWEAICANPTNAKFHAYLGAAFGDSRHYAEAALRESIRLKADDPLAHRLLARALENQGRHSEAVAAAHMAIHLEKDNYENHGMLGWCLARQGDLAGAEAAYREALKRNARSPFIYLDLACVLRRMGKNEEADAQFNEAKKFRVTTTNGTNFFSHANLGHYFARQSQFTNALQHYEAALHENPKDSHSAMRMAFLRHFQGDRGEYERICQQMLEVFKETTNPVDARRTVHVCLITPQIVGDLATHTKLEEHFRDQKTISSALLVLRERALLAYRRGAWDEALRLARASRAEVDKTRAVAQSANEEDSGGTEKQLRLSQAQNLVVEAMALHRQGQTAAARQAYSMAGRLNTASYPLAPEALDGAWVDWIIYELLRREARQLFCIDDSIDWRELVARGRAAAAKGDWKTAAAEFNRACESPAADSFYWLGAATATVRAGDTDLYRRHCLAMIEQFNGTGNWNDIERTLKNCALAKNDVQVPRKMLDFVSKGLDDGSAPRGLVAWANVGRALLAFRKADWDNAVRWADSAAADEVNSLQSQALALVTSALANHGKGDLERAKARLKEAITVHEQIPVPHLPDGSVDERLLLLENNGWVDWMNVSLLRQEAVALIGDVAPDRTLATATAPTGPSANPLLSDEAVNAARRIKGSVASWSPDGKKIVRNLNSSDMQNADLEVVDLITGTTTKLFHGGKDPAWSPLPGGPIACARFGRNGADLADEEIWLVQPDGTSPRKLTNGGFPSWTSDGRLFYRTGATTATWALQVVNPDQPNFQPQSFPGANAYPAVSPDGSLIAFAQRDPPSLVVRNVATSATVASINREQMGTLLASWSPDGRYVGYGDYRPNTEPGLWLLDVKTGRTRLLTTQRLTCPRWSPDGKTIAADDRLKSELVILDVSSLKLENGLPDAGSTESSASK